MSNEFHAATLYEAIASSTKRDRDSRGPETKSVTDVWAPPLTWGPWVHLGSDIYTLFGHTSEKRITYETASRAPSTFDAEIRTSGKIIRRVGPGSTLIQIPESSVTIFHIRAKSHSIGQHIGVTVS